MSYKKHAILIAMFVSAPLLLYSEADAGGFRGGGGRSIGGGGRSLGGGGGRSMGGRSMPTARPAVRPSAPGLGGSRPSLPNTSRPSVSRPSVSRPSVSPPNFSRPVNPPNMSRPSLPGSTRPSAPGFERPNISPPKPLFPSGPSTLPARPDKPGIGKPPTTLPARPDRPGGGNLPSTRPSFPSLGGSNPSRPSINPPAGRPSTLPGNRPNAGDLGGFLGMDKPIARPQPVRPGTPDRRPGLTNPVQRPNIGNGNIGNIGNGNIGNGNFNAGRGNTNINIGKINAGRNTVINNKPSWVNMNRTSMARINNTWSGQLNGMRNWSTRYPARPAYWRGWGNNVRGRWSHYHRHGNWFTASWWGSHRHRWCGWHYGYGFARYSWSYWWRRPVYANCVSWFGWASAAAWSQPIYYDYGAGGNVVYQDNSVYINGAAVATGDEFAQSAAELATVPPPATEAEAKEAEWMPLGTFAVSSDQKDVEPNRVVQLAVNKAGIVSGTVYDTATDQATSIQGKVDKETQRVAMRVGESDKVIIETGLYNLTQDDVPLLVHFGGERVENWLLIRLEDTSAEDAQ